MPHESGTRGLHKPPTVVDMTVLRLPGPPLRTADMAAMTGFTQRFIIMEIEEGHLVATRLTPTARWLITRPAAIEYLQRLGLIE